MLRCASLEKYLSKFFLAILSHTTADCLRTLSKGEFEMKSITKHLCFTLIFLMLVLPVITFATAPEWCNDTFDEIWNQQEYLRQIDEATAQTEKLDQVLKVVKSRVACKESIIDDLLEKRITLNEAGEKFLKLDQQGAKTLKMYYKIMSTTESSQLAILRNILAISANKPEHFKERLSELETEFALKFGSQPVY
jgi:hypothetical protein